MRVAPRPWRGLVAVAAYLAVIVAIQGTSGIPYPEMAASAGNLWRSGVLSIAAAGAVVAALASWWGWWRPALVERPTTPRRWTIIAPALLLVGAIGNLTSTDWARVPVDFIVAGLAVGVLVGFGEEFTVRGLLLVGLRGRLHEIIVWAVTCLLFGLLHGTNIALGAGLAETVVQMIFAVTLGSGFYIVRRVTGSLVWAMVLHGLWDFGAFANGLAPGPDSPLGPLSVPGLALAVLFGFLATKGVPHGVVERDDPAPAG